MGLCVKRSADFPGCSTVELADLGKEAATAEMIANGRCPICHQIIGVCVPFLLLDGKAHHNDCVQGRLL
jgi:hypothetical protein